MIYFTVIAFAFFFVIFLTMKYKMYGFVAGYNTASDDYKEKVDIEKIGGCNRMTCRCGHHFCWHCLEDYSAYGSHFCGRPDANQGIRGRRQQQLRTVSVDLDFLRQTLYELATDLSFNAVEEDVAGTKGDERDSEIGPEFGGSLRYTVTGGL